MAVYKKHAAPSIEVVLLVHNQPDCFHCGLPVPPGAHFVVEILDQPWAMCCRGCQAVLRRRSSMRDYRLIIDIALKMARQARNMDNPLAGLEVFDHPAVQKSFVEESDGPLQEVALLLKGTTCAACVWLNERRFKCAARCPGSGC